MVFLRFSCPSPLRSLALGGILFFASLTSANAASAASQMVVTYGPMQVSFEISDLQTLAETGEVPNALGFYLDLANLTPEDLRAILTTKIDVSHAFLDKMLNSEGGEYVLSEITQVVHTPSHGADVAALRSALVMAASDDQAISVLELLQTYPTEQIYINGGNLIQLASDLSAESVTGETVTGETVPGETENAAE